MLSSRSRSTRRADRTGTEVVANRRTSGAGDGIIPIVGDTIDGAEVTEVRPLSPARIDVLYAVGLAR